MPSRANKAADLTALTASNPVFDLDNVYLSDRGWAYRHYKTEDKSEFWDELLVAGNVASSDTPDAFGAASPNFETGDGAQMPVDHIYVVSITGAGSGYTTATGLATTGGTGTGLTVDIVADAGVITDINIAAQGDGAYLDGEELTVTTGGADATFTINIL